MKYPIEDIKTWGEIIIDDDKTFDELIEFYLPFRLSELDTEGILDSDKPKEQQAFRTNAGIVSGSPSYIAPETISGDDIDASTDIYSLGIMFYEMLTGKLPLIANTPYDYLREHLIGIPMTLNQGHSNNYWCRDLEQLLASMLAKEREDRPQSCQVILDAVNGGIRTKTLEQLKSPPKDAGGKSLFNNFFKLLGR